MTGDNMGDLDCQWAITLLDHGAYINATDNMRRTALMRATQALCNKVSHVRLVQLLCERGADVDMTDINGQTALMMAEQRTDCEEIHRILLRHSNEQVCQ